MHLKCRLAKGNHFGHKPTILYSLLTDSRSFLRWSLLVHYSDVTMNVMASQITSLTIVYSTVYSGADQRKHQSSATLAFVWAIHRDPVNSPHKGPVTRKMFPFDDVIMFLCHINATLREIFPGTKLFWMPDLIYLINLYIWDFWSEHLIVSQFSSSTHWQFTELQSVVKGDSKKFQMEFWLKNYTICKIKTSFLLNSYSYQINWNWARSDFTSLVVNQWIALLSSQRRHNGPAGVSNHQTHDWLLNRLFRWPVNSPHKRPVTRNMFPFDDVIM